MNPGAPGEPRQRRGWQLPGQDPARDDAPAPPRERPVDDAPAAARRPTTPAATLPNGLVGQVTDVSEATLQTNQVSEPIVTFRLERNDPHSGRSFVATVRLKGGDAVGFADVGDWIEAVGKRKSAHLVATRCVNHTTGAVYGHGAGRRVGQAVVVAVAVVVIVAIVAIVATSIIGQGASQREQCLDSGAPTSFCESLP